MIPSDKNVWTGNENQGKSLALSLFAVIEKLK